MTIHIKRMWGGGPLRQFSEKQEGACNRYYESPLMKGYTGAYVCDLCERPALGVYFVRGEDKWLCSPCRELVRLPKGHQQTKNQKINQRPLDSRAPK